MKVRSVWHLSGLSLLLLDYLACVLAVYWAMLFSPRLAVAQPLEVQGFGATLLGMPLFMAVSLHIAGVQDVRAGAKLAETAVLALTACVVGVLGFLFCSILIKYELVGRYVLGLSSFAAPLFVIGSRILVWRLASRHSRNVLFYSDRSDFRWAEDIVSAAKIPLRYVGAVKFEGTQDQKMVVVSIRSDVELIALCEQRGVHDIVVEAPSRLGSEERDLLLSCTAAGVHVSDLGGYVERVCDRVHLPSLTEAWFWSYDIAFAHPVYYAFKRMSDICVALIGLMIGAPVIMLAGMLI